jgi:hypothetical protein
MGGTIGAHWSRETSTSRRTSRRSVMIAPTPESSRRRMTTGSSTVHVTTRTPMSFDMATSRSIDRHLTDLIGTCAKDAVANAFGGRSPIRAHDSRAVSERQPSAVVTPGTSRRT